MECLKNTNSHQFLKHIHLSPEKCDPLRHFVTDDESAVFFPEPEWHISSNKKKIYTEDPNPRNPKTHKLIWGRLYAQKNK